MGNITVAHASNISSSDDELTLSAYTAGVRYLPRLCHSSLQPFGQVRADIARSSGTLVQEQNSAATNAGAAFAANLGGGLDLRASRRSSVRLVKADYLAATFDNGINGHQNNLRIGAGVVMRFG